MPNAPTLPTFNHNSPTHTPKPQRKNKHRKKKLFGKILLILILLGGLAYFLSMDNYPVYPKSDHYDPKTGKFFNPEPQNPIKTSDILPALWAMIADQNSARPNAPIPTVKPDWQKFLDDSQHSQFIWFGHSNLMMRVGGQTVMTDPVFGNYVSPVPVMMKRFSPPAITRDELPPVDVVMISHNHYDHLEKDTIRYFANKPTQFVVPLGMGVVLKKWGISAEKIHELDWWQSQTIQGVTYTAVPTRHDSGRGNGNKNKSLWMGVVIEQNGQKIYYSGDTAFGSHFAKIAERFGAMDVAFVENGQYDKRWSDSHMLPEQTAQVAHIMQAKYFVPVHWGAYALALHTWDDPVVQSVPLVKNYGITPLTPLQGQVFDVTSQTDNWWEKVGK